MRLRRRDHLNPLTYKAVFLLDRCVPKRFQKCADALLVVFPQKMIRYLFLGTFELVTDPLVLVHVNVDIDTARFSKQFIHDHGETFVRVYAQAQLAILLVSPQSWH